MKRWVLPQVGLLSVAFALATTLIGWWAVPVLGCFWGFYESAERRTALVASVAAGLGWTLLLLWTAAMGPLPSLVQRVAGVMGVPSISLIGLTVMFPMALAWGAGVLGGTARLAWKRRRGKGS